MTITDLSSEVIKAYGLPDEVDLDKYENALNRFNSGQISLYTAVVELKPELKNANDFINIFQHLARKKTENWDTVDLILIIDYYRVNQPDTYSQFIKRYNKSFSYGSVMGAF